MVEKPLNNFDTFGEIALSIRATLGVTRLRFPVVDVIRGIAFIDLARVSLWSLGWLLLIVFRFF